jgi:DNA-binding NarL/FixJ family response regulator
MNATDLAIPQLDLQTIPAKARRAALPPANDNLSPRERQVVALLHQGLTRKEVAYELGLNDATVRVHLWHANRKTRSPA